ncbi:site-specific recombinase [Glaciimonas sp. CA11.2]|uniref:site-specific recombinase n=1 Tax=Glaciimonas sp. CA11.2 TaxID=3048601 RepID=UPI002AB4EFFA|nr:site-specific recombinase [Glaciimonas sp. CA11.2]MDY7548230.1 site-specific recombinase [Glaciimonas sp. CA11.2]
MLSILNLIEADPHSDNVECLIALVKTLRPHLPENGSDAVTNVQTLIDTLQQNPRYSHALRHYLLRVYATRRQTSLYTDIGILPNAGFFTELFQRMAYRVLPPALDETYLRDCLDRVLPFETDYVWLNAISTDTWLSLIAVLHPSNNEAAVNSNTIATAQVIDSNNIDNTIDNKTILSPATAIINKVHTSDTLGGINTIAELLDATQTLSYRISAMGLEPSLIRLYPEMEDFESPFLMQNVELHRYLAGYRSLLNGEVAIINCLDQAHNPYLSAIQSNPNENTLSETITIPRLIEDAKHLQVMLDQCDDVVVKIRKNALKKGTSVALTYLLVRLDQSIARLRKLLILVEVVDIDMGDFLSLPQREILRKIVSPAHHDGALMAHIPTELLVTPAQTVKRIAAVDLARELVEAHNRKYAVRELFASNINLLARNITENASRTGEHYIAEDRSEFSAMFRSAAGAGLIIGFMAMMKILYSYLRAAPLVEAFLFSMNYSAGFMLIHVLHFTVATKQPAMTASRIAAGLHSTDSRHIDIDSLVDLIVKVFRTQFIAVTGNLLMVFPVAYLISVGWVHLFGHHLVTPDKAQHLLHDLDPLHSLALFHAAIAGVCLFMAGLISGYYDNRALYTHMAKRLERARWLRKILGKTRLSKVAHYLESNLGGLMGNFYFGILLGTIGTVGFMIGLPIDIRHITFSAANFAIALVGLDNQMGWQIAVRSIVGILAIGTINLWVSFSLALFVALRSRQVHFREGLPLTKAVLSRFLRRPIDFFIPPKDQSPDSESKPVA